MDGIRVTIRDDMLITAETDRWAFLMDAAKEKRAPSPMEAVLAALGGCTAVDVLSILRKMREPVREVQVHVSAERREEHPRVYTRATLRYVIRGNVSPEKAERAVRLSEEKYCSVGAMLRNGGCDIKWEYEILP